MAALILGAISLPSSGIGISSAVKIKPLLFTKKSQTSARRGQITISASYQVTLITAEGEKAVHVDPSDECILDAAERQGVALPYNCRSGACSSCVGMLKSGTVRQDDQTFPDKALICAPRFRPRIASSKRRKRSSFIWQFLHTLSGLQMVLQTLDDYVDAEC